MRQLTTQRDTLKSVNSLCVGTESLVTMFVAEFLQIGREGVKRSEIDVTLVHLRQVGSEDFRDSIINIRVSCMI
jgi:hypothetical protein